MLLMATLAIAVTSDIGCSAMAIVGFHSSKCNVCSLYSYARHITVDRFATAIAMLSTTTTTTSTTTTTTTTTTATLRHRMHENVRAKQYFTSRNM